MRVEILCTGDEILSGKTINTNYSHIARRLGELGLDVHWGTTVGDDRTALLQAFRQAGERSDAVIVNGGLGPTVDDLSQEIAAQAADVNWEQLLKAREAVKKVRITDEVKRYIVDLVGATRAASGRSAGPKICSTR